MKLIAAILVLLLSWVIPIQAQSPIELDKAKKELELFQGTWVVEKMIVAGEKTDLTGKSFRFEVKGTSVTNLDNKNKMTIAIDASKSPKQLDLVDDDEKKTSLGIYEIGLDTLTICLADHSKVRPTKFESASKTDLILLVLKKKK